MQEIGHIKLTAGVWPDYTGNIGTVPFEDGVSKRPVTMVESRRIAAITNAVWLDGPYQGKAGGSLEVTTAVRGNGQAAPTLEFSTPVSRGQTVTEAEKSELPPDNKIEQKPVDTKQYEDPFDNLEAEIDGIGFEELETEDDAKQPEPVTYDRAALEDIAVKKGIGGLREIATPLGLRGRATNELIDKILEAKGRVQS